MKIANIMKILSLLLVSLLITFSFQVIFWQLVSSHISFTNWFSFILTEYWTILIFLTGLIYGIFASGDQIIQLDKKFWGEKS